VEGRLHEADQLDWVSTAGLGGGEVGGVGEAADRPLRGVGGHSGPAGSCRSSCTGQSRCRSELLVGRDERQLA